MNSAASLHKEIFWGELAPFDRSFKSYEHDEYYFSSLASLVLKTFEAGETFLYIASQKRINALLKPLSRSGIAPDDAIKNYRLILAPLDETYKRFVMNGWPNDILFVEHISRLTERAPASLTIISEAVAGMWESGNRGATLHLENLCRQYSKAEKITLACAYPASGFTQTPQQSLKYILTNYHRAKESSAIV